MLFSNGKISRTINRYFEPAWQSVRPVPTVTIDFGNGHVIKRTLQGNVATYVCTSEGEVLDILPGIYEGKTYLNRILQLSYLAQMAKLARENKVLEIQKYHQELQKSLEDGGSKLELVKTSQGTSIRGIEIGVKITLRPKLRMRARGGSGRRHPRIFEDLFQSSGRPLDFNSPEELENWEALTEDTVINENIRRLKIHRYLAQKKKLLKVKDLTKWLYREVLNADLDDPYLGLTNLLFPGLKPKKTTREF